ncbi:hypothetical protein HDU76_004089 [Blyttiomyces sp. JEL0837]|nr:hypothetical protein HDU76_004089 [Blyttiomyces sp. JEL0837]
MRLYSTNSTKPPVASAAPNVDAKASDDGKSKEESSWRSQWDNIYKNTSKAATLARRALLGIGILYVGLNYYRMAKKNKELLTINDGTILTWRLDKTYVMETAREATSIIESVSRMNIGITLLDALKVLRWAKDDDRVVGMVIDLSTAGARSSGSGRPGLGMAQVQELREAIIEFKKAKKEKFGDKAKIVAVTDTLESQNMYYLASAFDEIRMEPIGFLPFAGVQIVQPFIKTLLDRIGITFRAHALGPYKSVNGMFTEPDGWTPPQRQNLTEMMGSIQSQLVNGIADARKAVMEKRLGAVKDGKGLEFVEEEAAAAVDEKKPEEEQLEVIEKLMDLGSLTSDECILTGLIDSIGYKREYLPDPAGLKELKTMSPKDSKPMTAMSVRRYLAARSNEKNRVPMFGGVEDTPDGPVASKPYTIGLVYLVGGIARGDGQFGSNAVARALIKAGRDEKVDAIVLRVDSGGGDVVATETIWDAVRYAQENCKKPVIASFGNVSASGGYYATSSCDQILCSPGTITGSIGVAVSRPVVTDRLLETLGVKMDEISFTEGPKAQSLFHDLSGRHLERFKSTAENIYKVFKKRVIEGRGLNEDKIDDVAGGRVFTGVDALKLGLVDQLGGIEKAIKIAAEIARLKRFDADVKKAASENKMVVISHKQHPNPPADSKDVDPEASIVAAEEIDLDEDVNIRVFPRRLTFRERLRGGISGDPTDDFDGTVSPSSSPSSSIISNMVTTVAGEVAAFAGDAVRGMVRWAVAEELRDWMADVVGMNDAEVETVVRAMGGVSSVYNQAGGDAELRAVLAGLGYYSGGFDGQGRGGDASQDVRVQWTV